MLWISHLRRVKNPTHIAVIGGGAAGFFAAINARENFPEVPVVLLEKSNKVLAKVLVSGGGRCNVTNGTSSIAELAKAYPRGGRQLRKLFGHWSAPETRAWFEAEAVELKTEDDGRVFPVTDSSQTIANCLLNKAQELGVELRLQQRVEAIAKTDDGIRLTVEGEWRMFSHVIVASGGSPTRRGLEWLEELGHELEEPVPSLFTFNLPGDPIRRLKGLSAMASVRIPGTKLAESGPVLITHWGLSGPGILKLSSWGARQLSDKAYRFEVEVNWAQESNQDKVLASLRALQASNPKKQLRNLRPFDLPARLWEFLLEVQDFKTEQAWGEIGKKGLQRMMQAIVSDKHQVSGKTTFKEEFVTCGGVSWNSISPKTLESKVVPGLYFAGEVLDIDAVTGGYNFQAAWTTGFIAAKLQS